MRLSLVTFLVPDYASGVAFLSRLGFGIVEDADLGQGKRWIVMRLPGGGSDLLVARAVGNQAEAVGRQAGGRVAYFLTTVDFDGDAVRVREAGGEFEHAPRCESYGRVAVFRDPFGNRWDLIGHSS